MSARGTKYLHDKYRLKYRGNYRNLVKIKFEEGDKVDGFYILLVSGTTIHGFGPDLYFVPKDALKMLNAENIKYRVLE